MRGRGVFLVKRIRGKKTDLSLRLNQTCCGHPGLESCFPDVKSASGIRVVYCRPDRDAIRKYYRNSRMNFDGFTRDKTVIHLYEVEDQFHGVFGIFP
jgi:hypothetical protein